MVRNILREETAPYEMGEKKMLADFLGFEKNTKILKIPTLETQSAEMKINCALACAALYQGSFKLAGGWGYYAIV